MKSPALRRLAPLAAFACLLAACGDKELEAKRDRLGLEIKRLEAELAVARGKLGEPLPDHSQDLEAARKDLAAAKADIQQLEQEVAALDDRKQELVKEFEAYQRKYRIQPATN